MTASDGRLLDMIDRMAEAARKAITFTDHVTFEDFSSDARTQMAVTMAFMLLGECANRLNMRYLEVTASHPDIPWAQIRGLRNIIAHEYYDLDLAVIWRTARQELPDLLTKIETMRADCT